MKYKIIYNIEKGEAIFNANSEEDAFKKFTKAISIGGKNRTIFNIEDIKMIE